MATRGPAERQATTTITTMTTGHWEIPMTTQMITEAPTSATVSIAISQ